MSDIQILGTGSRLVKMGMRGTGPVIEDMIKNSKSEIHIAAYSITPHARKIIKMINDALERGIKVTIVVNHLEKQGNEIRRIFKRMEGSYPYLKIKNFKPTNGDLHAKVIITDRQNAVIGSANFSFGGMARNYEIGVKIKGKDAWRLAKIIDHLAR